MEKIGNIKRFTVLLILIALLFACSKDKEISPPDKGQKSAESADKVFTDNPSGHQFSWGNLNSLFSNNQGTQQFTNNTGNNSFTNNQSGQGGGPVPLGNGMLHAAGHDINLAFGGYFNEGDGYFDLAFLDMIPQNVDDLTGFSGIEFGITSPSMEQIIAGDYVYSEDYEPFTFDGGGFAYKLNTEQDEELDIVDGSIGISGSGNNFSITFHGVLENGKTFHGNFTGNLMELTGGGPQPTSTMTAKIDGQSWSADFTSAAIEADLFQVSGGTQSGNQYIYLVLTKDMVASGAKLTMDNGGVFSVSYSEGVNFYSNSESATVNITTYSSDKISGNFSFSASNFSSESVNVTNGQFTNVPIY